MGLIKAGAGALGGTLADQWKEFFYCDSIPVDTLIVKGQKQISGRSSNTKGNDNIITNGSGIAVADGQCMIIVEDGKVVEVCAEPGRFTWDSSTEPSIFAGNLGDSLIATFKTIGKRFTYGGDPGKDQRVYYFNTKEILDNKFGTANPVPFRVVDSKIGLDVDVSVRCSGVYSYKIVDSILFYTNVSGNVEHRYQREQIDRQLKTEFISALQPAFGKMSDLEIRPNQIVSHTTELENAMNIALSEKWEKLRGIKVITIAIGSLTLPEEDAAMIKELQRTAVMKNPTMAAATLVGAQAEAMKSAAKNEAGAMQGFLGMGMAMNAGGMGGMNPASLFAMGNPGGQQGPTGGPNGSPNGGPGGLGGQGVPTGGTWTCSCGTQVNGKFCPNCGTKKPEPQPQGSWTCSCGTQATGKFCPNCGAKKPEPVASDGWTCSCGTLNTGKFCSNCGAGRPAPKPTYKCDKCGWKPEDGEKPPKFCPECGDPFNFEDIVK